MTETILKEKIFERFESLNDFSGLEFLNEKNVSYPNRTFVIPDKKTWFKVNCTFDEPKVTSLGSESQNRWVGIFQIDIFTPIGKGENESDNIYKWIASLFRHGTVIDNINVNKVYKALNETGDNFYKTVIRVEFDADLDN